MVPSKVPSTTAVPEKCGAGFCTRAFGVYAGNAMMTACGQRDDLRQESGVWRRCWPRSTQGMVLKCSRAEVSIGMRQLIVLV